MNEAAQKLFLKMADSHWDQCTADEEDEFLVELVEAGHKELAAFYENRRREDRKTFLESCEHHEDLKRASGW